jgi:hypothetical protein
VDIYEFDLCKFEEAVRLYTNDFDPFIDWFLLANSECFIEFAGGVIGGFFLNFLFCNIKFV